MSNVVNIVLLMVSLAVMVLSSQAILKSLTKISSFFGLKRFCFTFVIIAFFASLPELCIGINSAFFKSPELALGNVIGSSLIDLTLISGIGIAIAKKFKVKSAPLKKDSIYMFFTVILSLILIFIGGGLSRIDGIILVIVFILYQFLLMQEKTSCSNFIHSFTKKSIFPEVLTFLLGLIVLFFSSNLAVQFAINTFTFLNISPFVLGLVLLAIGTTLPEFSFTVNSLVDHKNLTLGDIVGSVITNSTLVLGITSIIMPITSELFTFLISAFFLVLAALLFTLFVAAGDKLKVRSGIALISVYIIFILIQIHFA